MRSPHPKDRCAAAGVCLALLTLALPGVAEETRSGEGLRRLEPASSDYRTPRAGEGFRTRIFGRAVEVPFRDRRSTSAWDLGGAAWLPAPEGRSALPFGALYFFRRPDEERFFRATVAGIDNDLVYGRALAPDSPLELVLGVESRTSPLASSERVDGERIQDEQVLHGRVFPALGVGVRRQVGAGFEDPGFRDGVDPQAPDNMFSLSLTFEPGYHYFDEGDDASDRFAAPRDGFELAGRGSLRWDALERNLLDLAHRGFALGADARIGSRVDWEDWGLDRAERAGRGRHPALLQSYAVVAAGLPGPAGERHRVIGSLHGGWGHELDRFSAPGLGGGPGGSEFLSLARPIVPGASIGEFSPEHYAVGIAEYRYELFFFSYLSARASAAWLERDRLGPGGVVRSEDDLLYAAGVGVTTGFLFETRLQLDYNYGFDVIRERERGGSELVLHLSRSF